MSSNFECGERGEMRGEWVEVCREADLVKDSGVCVLLEGEQVALFRDTFDGAIYAIANHDPFARANVLSRGLIGSLGGRVVVASPLYKQHFCLSTGQCLEDADVRLRVWPVKVEEGRVLLQAREVSG